MSKKLVKHIIYLFDIVKLYATFGHATLERIDHDEDDSKIIYR